MPLVRQNRRNYTGPRDPSEEYVGKQAAKLSAWDDDGGPLRVGS